MIDIYEKQPELEAQGEGVPPNSPDIVLHETGGGYGAEFWRIVRANGLSPGIVDFALNESEEI